tara:strand:+ start:6508 stop:6849 length:342 start_codon:yes stop_codon:yes gene_type:complete
MLDYYGSIVKSDKEIDTEIISNYINKCNETYIEKLISDLRKEDKIHKKYSISGWNVFGRTSVLWEIDLIFKKNKEKNEKKLKTYYCLDKYFILNDIKDNDIITSILLIYDQTF